VAGTARARGRTDVLLFLGCVLLSIVALALPAPSREPIASALRTTAVAPLVGLQHGAQQWRGAWQSRDRETAERDSLILRAIEAKGLVSENAQLRELLGLAHRLETGFVPALAMTPDAVGIVKTIVLSAGSNAGVEKYSPVVAPEGLVGTVVEVNPTMSVANLYTSPDFRVAAMTADGSASGIVGPYLERGMLSRDRQYLLEFRGVPHRIQVAPGTQIFTNGFGGIHPRGVAIGTVLREIDATAGLTRTYLLVPAVNPSRISAVLVLTRARAQAGVGNIWMSPASPDSARRKIVEAGDSVQRAAARLEDLARRASLDSVRRATIDSMMRFYVPPGVAPPVARPPVARPPVVRPPDTTTRVPPDTTAHRGRAR
jgi:rod shape-determining protein MreC